MKTKIFKFTSFAIILFCWVIPSMAQDNKTIEETTYNDTESILSDESIYLQSGSCQVCYYGDGMHSPGATITMYVGHGTRITATCVIGDKDGPYWQ